MDAKAADKDYIYKAGKVRFRMHRWLCLLKGVALLSPLPFVHVLIIVLLAMAPPGVGRPGGSAPNSGHGRKQRQNTLETLGKTNRLRSRDVARCGDTYLYIPSTQEVVVGRSL